jgi:transposase-like protein
MSVKRRQFSSEFKARIVVEMLKEEKSHGELSAEHGIHVHQMRRWKDTVIEQLPPLTMHALVSFLHFCVQIP